MPVSVALEMSPQTQLSSLRKQGPITTGFCESMIICHRALLIDSAVWVPAFAGTTTEYVVPALTE
ncbi:hypothetical protein BRAS3843_860024 [Bradyrhizobium sp. STM 3843]|nr:hypothetical protein BRAS3843_860024 [Bradyrhizobium sp. STM 3843]